jgi:tripartite-type tricarboxylate transporter receptor subunit TctC
MQFSPETTQNPSLPISALGASKENIQMNNRSWSGMATLILSFALTGLTSLAAQAQTYPTKPVRWVTGVAAGGGSDAMLRQVSAQLTIQLGQPVTVDNRPSAGSLNAAGEVAKAAGDGYTLLAADNGVMVLNPAVYKKLPYETSNFAPIGVMVRAPLLLVASPTAGYKNAKDMLDAAKANPGKIAYASPGTGSPFHLAMEMLKSRAGIQLVRVPFGSDTAALKDVLAGSVALSVIDLPSALPHIKAGKLQVLATFSTKRQALSPDAPTMSELGFKELDAYLWQSLVLPAAAPKEIQAKLTQAMQSALAQTSLRKSLSETGWEILASDANLMNAFIGADTRVWHRLIKEAGISAD